MPRFRSSPSPAPSRPDASWAETKYQLGRLLKFDPERERFVSEAAGQANALLTRDYRKPYVVPHKT